MNPLLIFLIIAYVLVSLLALRMLPKAPPNNSFPRPGKQANGRSDHVGYTDEDYAHDFYKHNDINWGKK